MRRQNCRDGRFCTSLTKSLQNWISRKTTAKNNRRRRSREAMADYNGLASHRGLLLWEHGRLDVPGYVPDFPESSAYQRIRKGLAMIPLLATVLFPCGGIPLDPAELDAFPDTWLIWKWQECCAEFMERQQAGLVWDECYRLRGALSDLSFAKEHRDFKRNAEAVRSYAGALREYPEWRWTPARVTMLPYHLLIRKEGVK